MSGKVRLIIALVMFISLPPYRAVAATRCAPEDVTRIFSEARERLARLPTNSERSSATDVVHASPSPFDRSRFPNLYDYPNDQMVFRGFAASAQGIQNLQQVVGFDPVFDMAEGRRIEAVQSAVEDGGWERVATLQVQQGTSRANPRLSIAGSETIDRAYTDSWDEGAPYSVMVAIDVGRNRLPLLNNRYFPPGRNSPYIRSEVGLLVAAPSTTFRSFLVHHITPREPFSIMGTPLFFGERFYEISDAHLLAQELSRGRSIEEIAYLGAIRLVPEVSEAKKLGLFSSMFMLDLEEGALEQTNRDHIRHVYAAGGRARKTVSEQLR